METERVHSFIPIFQLHTVRLVLDFSQNKLHFSDEKLFDCGQTLVDWINRSIFYEGGITGNSGLVTTGRRGGSLST